MKRVMLVSIVVGVALAGGLARAQGMPGPMPPPEDMAKELGLSAKQKTAIRDLTDEERKTEAKLRAEIEVAQIDLRRMLEADDPDETKIGEQIEKVSALEGTAHKTHLLTFVRVRKLLTKEQRAKLDAMHEDQRRGEGELRDPFAPAPPQPPQPPAKAPRPPKPPKPPKAENVKDPFDGVE